MDSPYLFSEYFGLHAIVPEPGHKLGIAIALEALASVSAIQGDGAHAVMLFATAHTLREAMGAPLPPIDCTAHDSAVAASRAQLGDAVFADLWARAATRPFKEVVEEILRRMMLVDVDDVLFQLLNNLRVDEQRHFWIVNLETYEDACDIREDLGQMGTVVKIAFPVSHLN